MYSNETPPFTQDLSGLEKSGKSDRPEVHQNQRAVSSAVERSRHMREVVGSTPTPPTNLRPIEIAHFWAKVEIGLDFECWPWRGPLSPNGYGRYRKTGAHRVSYALIKGPVPDDVLIRHSCDNRPCCNPHHLLSGTHQDNASDAVERRRTARGQNHGRSKLTETDVVYIRANPDRLTGDALAAKFSVGKSTISFIRNGRSWKYSGYAA